jgi:hypothetical protein
MKRYLVGFVFAVLTFLTPVAANESIVMVDLVFGQSGSLNYGTAVSAFPGGWTADPGIQIWNATAGAWQTYAPGTNATGSTSVLWGPEAEFERQKRLARPDITRYVIKLGIGGCGIAEKPVGVCDWNPLSNSLTDTSKAWGQLWNVIVSAVGALPTGKLTLFESILVVNGETDSILLADANQFQKNEAMLVLATKQRFSIQNAHVIMVRPSNNFPDISTPYISTVRAAVDTLGALPGWASVNVDDLTEAPAPYAGHLDAPSTVTEGLRMFQADRAILP